MPAELSFCLIISFLSNPRIRHVATYLSNPRIRHTVKYLVILASDACLRILSDLRGRPAIGSDSKRIDTNCHIN